MKKVIAEGRLQLEDIQPWSNGRAILFPITAEAKYIEEDGRDFGYPVDSGWVTIIEVDYAVGALVEETIEKMSKISEKNKPTPPSLSEIISAYDEDRSWIGELSKEWMDDDSIEEGWLEEESLGDYSDKMEWLLFNSGLWPEDWITEYEKHKEKYRRDFKLDSLELIVKEKYGSTLYKNSQGEYFVHDPPNYYTAYILAGKKSVEKYLREYAEYRKDMLLFVERAREVKRSLKMLKENL